MAPCCSNLPGGVGVSVILLGLSLFARTSVSGDMQGEVEKEEFVLSVASCCLGVDGVSSTECVLLYNNSVLWGVVVCSLYSKGKHTICVLSIQTIPPSLC